MISHRNKSKSHLELLISTKYSPDHAEISSSDKREKRGNPHEGIEGKILKNEFDGTITVEREELKRYHQLRAKSTGKNRKVVSCICQRAIDEGKLKIN